MLSETEVPVWVLSGFKHLLFSAGDCNKLLALFVGAVWPIAVRGKGVKSMEAQMLYSWMVILC